MREKVRVMVAISQQRLVGNSKIMRFFIVQIVQLQHWVGVASVHRALGRRLVFVPQSTTLSSGFVLSLAATAATGSTVAGLRGPV